MDHLDQQIHAFLLSFGFTGEAMFRLLLAATAGGIVGVERELAGREAGFRTNLLVSLGSALVMVVSIRFADSPWHSVGGYAINIDPGRIAYSVMGGIGFLGAGAILKHGTSVRGLTTAAGLWCVAAIGLAAGFGLYVLTILSSVLVLFALFGLNQLEQHVPRRRFRILTIRLPWQDGCIQTLAEKCRAAGIEVIDQSYRRSHDLATVDVQLLVTFVDRIKHESLEQRLHTHPDFLLIASERA